MEIGENDVIGENIENLFYCERSKRYEQSARRAQSEYLLAGCFGRCKPSKGVQGRSPGKIMAFQHIYNHFRVNEPIFE